MKTFKEFIIESNQCVINSILFLFEGKYSDEHAFRKVWNHFITHRKYGKDIRNFINAGKYDEAREAMEKEIAAARKNPKHPLSFEKAKRGFEKGKDTNPSQSQSTYYDELQLAPDSVVAYTKGRRGKSAANRSTAYAKVEGGATPPTTRMWKDVVGKEADTSKRDISIADTKDKKFGQGISLKQGEGSQTLSAEPEEVRGLFQSAAKKYIQKLKKDGASEEEIEKFKADLEYTISKYVRAQNLKISPTENKSKSDKRLSIAQSAVDTIVKNYPGFDRLVDKEAAGGEQKFGKKVSAQLDPESQEFKDALTAMRLLSSKESPNAKINKSDLEVGELGEIKKIANSKKYKNNPKQLKIDYMSMDRDDPKRKEYEKAYKLLTKRIDVGDLEKGQRERIEDILTKYPTKKSLSDFLKSSPSGQATEVIRGTYVDPKTGEVVSRAKSEPVSQRRELDQDLAARSGKGKSSKTETGFIEFEKRRRGEEPQRIQRSGALAGRVGPAKPDEKNSRQSTFVDFSKKVSSAQKALDDAEREQADSSVIRFPNGKPVPRKNQYYLQNNPGAAQQHSARQEVATQAVDAARSTLDTLRQKAAELKTTQKPEPTKPESQQQPTSQIKEPVKPEPQSQPQTAQPQLTQQQTPPPEQQNQRKKRIQPQQPVPATPITQ